MRPLDEQNLAAGSAESEQAGNVVDVAGAEVVRRIALLLALLSPLGCGDEEDERVYRELDEPNDDDELILGTGGSYSVSGRCSGEDEEDYDEFGLYVTVEHEEASAALDFEWSVFGADGYVSVAFETETLVPGESDAEVTLNVTGFAIDEPFYVRLGITCNAGAEFDYSGEFGVR